MTKVALCVGLNYPGTPAQLSGCVNDAHDWAARLSALGYDARTVLEPTKGELVETLQSIVATLRFGDRLVFTYSGHGTWVPDRDGDEPDGRDEALCPADYVSGVLTDDELFDVFGAARFGVRRLIVSDSCHSGSVARLSPAGGLFAAGRGRARFLPPAAFLDGAELRRAERVERSRVRSVPRKGTVLLSGCGDLEYSYDATFGGRPNGAFTYHALATLGGNKIGAWHRAIRERLPSQAYPQTPQLTVLPHQRYWRL